MSGIPILERQPLQAATPWAGQCVIPKPKLRVQATLVVGTTVVLAAGLLTAWALDQPGGYIQIAAGIGFVATVLLIIFADAITRKLDLVNIKYIVLFGLALFLGLGMVADANRPDYAFSWTGIILSYASLILFLAGFGLVRRPAKMSESARLAVSITPNQLYYLSIVFFVLGFAFLYLEWELFGVLVTYSGGLASETREIGTPMPCIHILGQLTFPAAIMTLIQFRRGVAFIRKCVLASLLTVTLVYYFLWGARSNLVWVTLACAIAWLEVPSRSGSRRVGLKPLVVCLVAGAAILALSSIRAKMSVEAAREIRTSQALQDAWGSLDTYTQLRRTIDFFPQRADYLWGYSFYGIAANPIPRVLWEGKPMGVGKLASILYDGNPHSTIALSLPGEFYANFGIVGALIGMFLSGLLTGGIYRWYRRRRGDYGAIVVYVLVLSYIMWEVRGDMLDATMPLFYFALPVGACFALVSTMNRIRLRQLQLAAFARSSGTKAFRITSPKPNYHSPEPETR